MPDFPDDGSRTLAMRRHGHGGTVKQPAHKVEGDPAGLRRLPTVKSPGVPIISFPRVDTLPDTMWSIGSKLKPR